MSGKPISTSATRVEALQLQSSAYGVVVALCYGVTRVPLNLLDYRNFVAVPHTQTQGGKGGTSMRSTDFSYTVDMVAAIGHGPVASVPRVWRGKKAYAGGITAAQVLLASEGYTPPGSGAMTYALAHAATYLWMLGPSVTGGRPLVEGVDYSVSAGTVTVLTTALRGVPLTWRYQYTSGTVSQAALQALGLTLRTGALFQSVWSALSGTGTHELGYSGKALLCGQAYDLGSTAQMENHNVEVVARGAYHVGFGVPDVDASLVVADILLNHTYGAGLPASMLGDWSAWSDWCVAGNLLVSPALTEQQSAADVLDMAAKLTGTGPVWSGGVLRMVPYADTSISSNGRLFTPDTTPVYELTDDAFIAPLECRVKSGADRKNHVRVEYRDREHDYNTAVIERKDQTDIDVNGLRSADVMQAHWVCAANTAALVADLTLARSLHVVNEYTGKLPWHFALLEPMDLVTVDDAGLGLAATPLRTTVIEESEDGDLTVTFEDYPAGVASPALYPHQVPAGYVPDYNVAPGSASAPVIFELPGALTTNGLELAVAATGLGAGWGGCHVWVSLDGTNYKQVGTINGGSRYGQLTAAAAATGSVAVSILEGQLLSGSAADAAALNTLCYIGGADEEFFAYQSAVLTSALHYTLTDAVVRGAYSTTPHTHAAGAAFVRVDDAVARSGPIDLGYVGKTVHVKLTSFNLYGGGEEQLSAATDYTYTISGARIYGNAGAAALAGVTAAASDNVLSAGEKSAVILDYSAITADQSGLDAQATSYGITTEKAAYDSAITSLTSYLTGLTPAWNDTTQDTPITGTTLRARFASVYAAKQTLVNAIMAGAKTRADNAASAAADAQADATAALSDLADIASDSLLTPDEKPRVVQDYSVITTEQAGIDAQAVNYAVTTEKATYDAAVSALTAYLGGLTSPTAWNNLAGSTTIVGATFRSKFAAVYTAKQALLDKISANAKARLGGLATLNSVGTGEIDAGAVTQPMEVTVSDADINTASGVAVAVCSLTFTAPVDCTVEITVGGNALQESTAPEQYSCYGQIRDTFAISATQDTQITRNASTTSLADYKPLALIRTYTMSAGATSTFYFVCLADFVQVSGRVAKVKNVVMRLRGYLR